MPLRDYKTIKFTNSKKENLSIFFIVSLTLILIFSLFINLFFFRLYLLKSVINEKSKKIYLVELLTKEIKKNDFVLAYHPRENSIYIAGKIVGTENDKITISNNVIIINNQKIFLKNPLPEVFNKKEEIYLKKDEYVVISDISIDSFEIGVLKKENIVGKIIYSL